MRPVLLLAILAAACAPAPEPNPPPAGRFYFPTGIVHADAPGSTDGVLYVASSNVDRRFDFGAVTAVDLSRLAEMPAFGAPPAAGGPVRILDLRLSEASVVHVDNFAGEMEGFQLATGELRLFTPSRAEGDHLMVLESPGGAELARLGCVPPGEQDCVGRGVSLTALQRASPGGLPRAPAPVGVGISGDGEVFVTHALAADSPPGKGTDPHHYLVRTRAEEPKVTAEDFVDLGIGGTNSVAVGRRYAYATGRAIRGSFGSLLRLVDRQDLTQKFPALESQVRLIEARGLALAKDESRVYIAGRGPDVLVVADVTNPDSIRVVRTLPLPDGPNQVRLLERPGRGNLLVISCSDAGVVVLYDDDAGAFVAQIPDVGSQPFGLAVDRRDPGARIYASAFGDGTVAVIDVPDLLEPHRARLVARLGQAQTCLVNPKDASCPEVTP